VTQSGQGEEPSAREAREGIVLPSDGGEPLLPGMTGGYGGGRPSPIPPASGSGYGQRPGGSYGRTPGSAHGQEPGESYGQESYGQESYGQAPGSAYSQGPGESYGQESYGQGPGAAHGQASGPASAPAGGQAWGTPWGPDQHQAPAPPPGQGWQAPPAPSWSTAESGQSTPPAVWSTPETLGGTPSPSLPPEGGHASAYGAGTYGSGAGTPSQPTRHATDPPTSYYLPPVGQGTPETSAPPAGNYGPSAPLPPADAYDSPAAGAPQPPAQHGIPGGAPLPPADEGATQYIAPAIAGGGAEGVTPYNSPVGPGALPPEVGTASPAEATQFLGRAPQGGSRPGAGPLPPVAAAGAGPLPPAAGPDAEATQYIAPLPGQQPAGAPYGGQQGGDRQPPAEFDNLFRGGPDGERSPAAATQQLPRFQQPEATSGAQPPYAQPSYAPPGAGGAGYGTYDDGDGTRGGGRGGRTGSRLPVIAAVGVGIAVLGIGAGALLAGGGDHKGDAKNQTVSATAPATDGSASPSADPAEQQAVALDKLLADSGSSRTTVINAVESVKSCKNVGQAAKDLRGAAQQRTGLVTQLAKLSVDKLPDHAALTDALTKAWQASASADNHYAAWADQTAGKKGCKKGQARITGQTQAGNRASGTASTEKVEAARLWNAIAKTYGLTQRQPTQL
jgi:hypothetical protein